MQLEYSVSSAQHTDKHTYRCKVTLPILWHWIFPWPRQVFGDGIHYCALLLLLQFAALLGKGTLGEQEGRTELG